MVPVHSLRSTTMFGTGDGAEFAVGLGDPGNGEAVVEAEGELHADGNFAARAANDADDVRVLAARRHEVGEADLAGCGGEGGLEDEGAGAIAALDRGDFVAGPEAASSRCQQCRAGRRSRLPEAKLGQQSQSMEPWRLTSAAVSRSPMTA